MPRILGLDIGERRIGIAISTPEGGLAVPLRILEREKEPVDIERIAEIARSEDAGAIVVGDPLSLDGSVGPQARSVRAFARRLQSSTGLRVELWDERLTSVQAGRSPSRQRGPIDDLAAAIILQAYLDRQRSAE